jgi:hypothetical protein
MTVRRLDDGTIALEGVCPIEDAENLLLHLLETPGVMVDWRTSDEVHTAVVQVMMAFGVKPVGLPRSPFLARFVAPVVGDNES